MDSHQEKDSLSSAMRTFIRDYEWIHIGLGLIGNTSFFVGSILFLWKSAMLAGTWLFIIGSLGMLIGSVGSAVVRYEERGQRGVAAGSSG